MLRLPRRQRRRCDRTGACARRPRTRRAPDQQRAAVPMAGGCARPVLPSVDVPSYPLFREPQYLLALANAIARIADERRLDIVHAHYAVPHATAAYLAVEMLVSASSAAQPKIVTTLHGTDITLVGSDRSYAWVVGIFHRAIRRRHRGLAKPQGRHDRAGWAFVIHIDVIPNFLDCDPIIAVRKPRFGRARSLGRRDPDCAHVELPAGQARRRRARRVPPDAT